MPLLRHFEMPPPLRFIDAMPLREPYVRLLLRRYADAADFLLLYYAAAFIDMMLYTCRH